MNHPKAVSAACFALFFAAAGSVGVALTPVSHPYVCYMPYVGSPSCVAQGPLGMAPPAYYVYPNMTAVAGASLPSRTYSQASLDNLNLAWGAPVCALLAALVAAWALNAPKEKGR